MKFIRVGIISVLALMVGCGEGGEDDPTAEPTVAATPTAPPAVTWHRDIQPLVERSCTRCHVDGGVGPSDLSTFEKAAPMASVIASYVGQGLMPPSVADPECRDYDGSETLFLNLDERALFQEWADLGAPEGSIADAPVDALQTAEVNLDDYDLKLNIKPYSPRFDASGNDYTCFVLEPGFDKDVFITAMAPLINQIEISHHLLLYKDANGDVRDQYGTEPFKCGDNAYATDPNLAPVSSDWESLTAWAPGGPIIEFAEGMGMPLNAGEPLVLQMHYFDSSPGSSLLVDTSGYALKTADSIERRVYQLYPGPTDFVIPPGDESYSSQSSIKWLQSYGDGLEILGVFPHMHVLGQSWRYWIESNRAEEDCLSEGVYDFNNQLNYMFEKPALLEPGDTLVSECTWNNSTSNPHLIYDPPIEVRYGEGTDAEMCFMISYVVAVEED